jgi:hypothetical protein
MSCESLTWCLPQRLAVARALSIVIGVYDGALLLILLAIGATFWGVPAVNAQAPSSRGSTGWIIGAPTLMKLKQVGADDALIATAFDNSSTYVIARPKIPNRLAHAVTAQTFTSYAELEQAFADATIAPTTKAILFDIERWRFTPENEQLDPVGFTAKAAALAHQHGLLLIATPATNLANLTRPGSDKYDAFLSLKIIGELAKIADVLEVQAQQAQGTPRYTEFVRAASAQAHAANPSVIFFAGMSTNPLGRAVTPEQLVSDYQTTRRYVSGYWLNVPARSPYCPTCGEPRPEVAVALLRAIWRNR